MNPNIYTRNMAIAFVCNHIENEYTTISLCEVSELQSELRLISTTLIEGGCEYTIVGYYECDDLEKENVSMWYVVSVVEEESSIVMKLLSEDDNTTEILERLNARDRDNKGKE
jgi:hypothetical protein